MRHLVQLSIHIAVHLRCTVILDGLQIIYLFAHVPGTTFAPIHLGLLNMLIHTDDNEQRGSLTLLNSVCDNDENLKVWQQRNEYTLEYVTYHLYSLFTSCRSMLYAIFISFFTSLHPSVINNQNKNNKEEESLSIIMNNSREAISNNNNEGTKAQKKKKMKKKNNNNLLFWVNDNNYQGTTTIHVTGQYAYVSTGEEKATGSICRMVAKQQ